MTMLTFHEWYQQRDALNEACDPVLLEGFFGDFLHWVKTKLNIDEIPKFWWNNLLDRTHLISPDPSMVLPGDYILDGKTGRLFQVIERRPGGDASCQRVKPVVRADEVVPELMPEEELLNIASLARNPSFRYVPKRHGPDFWSYLVQSLKELAYTGPQSAKDMTSKPRGQKATSELERRSGQEGEINQSTGIQQGDHGSYLVTGQVPGQPNKYVDAWKIVRPGVWIGKGGGLAEDIRIWKNDVDPQFISDFSRALGLLMQPQRLKIIKLVEGKTIPNFTPFYNAWERSKQRNDRDNPDDNERFLSWFRSIIQQALFNYEPKKGDKVFTRDDFVKRAYQPSKS